MTTIIIIFINKLFFFLRVVVVLLVFFYEWVENQRKKNVTAPAVNESDIEDADCCWSE